MKQYLSVNTTTIGSVFLSLLMGGCALQPTKSTVPAQLEREIKTIEDAKSTTAYQPLFQAKRQPTLSKKVIPCGAYRKGLECQLKQF